jgi:hypothetical protein
MLLTALSSGILASSLLTIRASLSSVMRRMLNHSWVQLQHLTNFARVLMCFIFSHRASRLTLKSTWKNLPKPQDNCLKKSSLGSWDDWLLILSDAFVGNKHCCSWRSWRMVLKPYMGRAFLISLSCFFALEQHWMWTSFAEDMSQESAWPGSVVHVCLTSLY